MEQIPPAFQVGGIIGLLALTYIAFLKGWILTSREGDDLRSQRDRADARAERLLDINAAQSEALKEYARKEDLSVKAMQAVERKVAQGGEQ